MKIKDVAQKIGTSLIKKVSIGRDGSIGYDKQAAQARLLQS